MTEKLKTLKDIEADTEYFFKKALRAEAIKWIKAWYLVLHNEDKVLSEKAYTSGAIESFKQFFNITEEELK